MAYTETLTSQTPGVRLRQTLYQNRSSRDFEVLSVATRVERNTRGHTGKL